MRPSLYPAFVALVLLASMLACNLPRPSGVTPSPEIGIPVTSPEAATIPPEPTDTVAPTETPVSEPAVVTFAEGAFNLYTLGGSLLETRPAPGLDWVRPGKVQVLGQSIYYVDSGEAGVGGVVKRVSQSGTEELSFTAALAVTGLTFAVNRDESKIAWGHSGWVDTGPESQMWIANRDGSGALLAAESSPNDTIEDYYIVEPYRWTPEGDLLYAWQITGIGGYILFFGYSSLYRYSPVSAAITPLVPAEATGGPCWNSVSPDGVYLVGSCVGTSGVEGMRERNLLTGEETVFPVWPGEQGQAGAGAYSPTGSRLAYAIARGEDPNNEAGRVLVVLSRGEDPLAIASITNGYFSDLAWVDEERLIVGSWQGDAASVQLLGIDGAMAPLASGSLVGLMHP